MKFFRFLLPFLVTLSLLGCKSTSIPPIPDPEPTPDLPSISEPIYNATMISMGDNLIHNAILRNTRENGTYNFDKCYKNVYNLINEHDIATINQETVVNDAFAPSHYPKFSTPIEMGYALENLGIDVITLANNHIFDKGDTAVLSSLNFFANKTKILTTGAYKSQLDFNNIRTLEKNGITFSFVSATESTNGLSIPKSSEVVLLKTQNEDELIDRIIKASQISDVVVVNVHWGSEYVNTPSSSQKELSVKMANAGATVIIGHHPHVLQPIEYINTDDGGTSVVAYSLGNFLSAQDTRERMIGGMLDVSFEKTGDKTKITSVSFIPTVTHYEYDYKNIQVIPFKDYTNEMAKKHNISLSLDFIQNYVSNIVSSDFLK